MELVPFRYICCKLELVTLRSTDFKMELVPLRYRYSSTKSSQNIRFVPFHQFFNGTRFVPFQQLMEPFRNGVTVTALHYITAFKNPESRQEN